MSRVNALAPGWELADKQRELWGTPEAPKAHLDRQGLTDTLDAWDMADTMPEFPAG